MFTKGDFKLLSRQARQNFSLLANLVQNFKKELLFELTEKQVHACQLKTVFLNRGFLQLIFLRPVSSQYFFQFFFFHICLYY